MKFKVAFVLMLVSYNANSQSVFTNNKDYNPKKL